MKKELANTAFIWRLLKKHSRKRIFLCVLSAVIKTLKSLINVFSIGFALYTVTELRSFRYLLIFVASQAAVSLLLSYLECRIDWMDKAVEDNRIVSRVKNDFYEKTASVDMNDSDDPAFYEKMFRALNSSVCRIPELANTVELILTSASTIVILGVTTVFVEPVIVPVAILSAVIGFLANNRIVRKSHKADTDCAGYARKMSYVERILYQKEYFEDLKTSDSTDFVLGKLDSSVNGYVGIMKKARRSIALLDVVKNWQLYLFTYGLVALFAGYKVISGITGISLFTSIIYSAVTISTSVQAFLFGYSQLTEHSLYAEYLREILEYRGSMETPDNPAQIVKGSHSVELKNVSFRYNGSDDYVIRNVSMAVRKGEKIALVGENGAGKTTLARLILRLYDPQEGSLLLDGTDYRDYDVKELRKEFSVVLQDHRTLAFPLGENVCRDEITDENTEKINGAIRASGLGEKVSQLKDGIFTPVSTEFDENGVQLSGGQRQKLAIARAVYTGAGVIVMDEPSSSLDPRSEYEMYRMLNQISQDKTVILISHKLYSVKDADVIYYVENGSIAEQGSHRQLMDLNGKYASLFRVQASQYSDIGTGAAQS